MIDRLQDYYTKTKVQPYYAFSASMEAGKRMDEPYRRLSAYRNIGGLSNVKLKQLITVGRDQAQLYVDRTLCPAIALSTNTLRPLVEVKAGP